MKQSRSRLTATFAVTTALVATLVVSPSAPASAGTGTITIDAGAVQGVVQPTVVGQMAEWAYDEMNGAWAERLRNRSFETETLVSSPSTLYDDFSGSSLDRSKWTPLSLNGVAAGTATVGSGQVSLAAAAPGRWGIASNNLGDTTFTQTTVETRIVSASGTNAILSMYGGSGAGDFTKFVEFAVEGGSLKVYADGLPAWTGGAATLPATLKVVVSALSGSARDLDFYYNGALVHSISGYTLLPADFRAFLYGYSGTVVADYVTVAHDDTYDGFGGTTLSSRWTPTLLEGSTAGSVSVSGGRAQITGTAGSRYALLSQPVRNSAVDWTTIDARLTSVSGTNGLINIYGGSGAGDFSKFMEFGVEGGVARVFAPNGYTWTGAAVTLPATLSVQVSPYYANGRSFRFYVNGTKVHELWDRKDVPKGDFRVGLYGYGTSVTQWDRVGISGVHLWDQFAPGFEGGPGLSVEWTPISLAGGWGSASQGNSQLTVNGAASSRYGVLSQRLEESDVYGYTIDAKLDSVSGTNGLLNVYAGSGRGDFSKFVEFGVEGGVLKVFGDGVPTWTGPSVTTPARLRIEVSPWKSGGRTFSFFHNGALVHQLDGVTAVGNQEFQVFAYGYGASTTKWDYITWNRQGSWFEDGYADRATYATVGGAYNGNSAQRVQVTQHTTGRKGIAQRDVQVSAGKQYAFSVWLKQTGLSAPVTVSLGPATGDGPSYTPYATATLSGVTGSWAKYTATLTPSTTDAFAKLFIGTAGTGTLLIDMPSLMPLDPSEVAYGGWRKEFVDRVDALDPVMIRWPGGIIADSYDWSDGVGARDSRAPMYFAQWDAQWMTNDVGTHEILDLAQAMGLQVILNVNWGQGTATNAANWVEYVNGSTGTTQGALRSANGKATPWGVKHWEIGNEVWGWWTPGNTDATTFANSYVQFRDAMNAKDSTIEVIGEGGDGNSSSQAWNTTLVQTANGKIDQLAVHYYSPQPLPQNYSSSSVYSASMGAALTIGDRLAASGDTILANSTNDIKLAVLEHAAMYFNEEHRRTRTLEGGLAEAGILNLLMRRPDLNEINAASTLVNFWDGGSFRIGNRGSFVTPAYEVQKLVGAQHGELLVSSSATSGTYNAPAMGNLPARSNVPYLDVTTTRSADGSKLYVSVLNRDPASATTASLSIAGAGAIGSTATARTVTSGDYLDQNTWQNPTAVQTVTTTVTGVGSSFSYAFPAHSYTVLTIDTSATAVTLPAVTGRVTTSAGAAISGATVEIVGGASTTTNANGYFLISGVSTGTVSVRVTKSGYTTYTRNQLEVSATGATTLPIRLVP
ncbi:carboxypeptidase regulatory-like domain-containing protein [Microbacterium aurum]|uniref:alpha-L-arabinofuranosidase C-terminal domain-containing protein n=1 Tax=Microbacterium aurum TaxID=36805 RepID=UPI001EF659E8|nr:alpha-L-arabinofuranosidase C-terminal domain-containing protein [Microbacterium aurum]MCG7415771.1 carboxypeptidase regulatory-like domain-containing protein [Microbacterium aurum]